jgi:hypothetical protein
MGDARGPADRSLEAIKSAPHRHSRRNTPTSLVRGETDDPYPTALKARKHVVTSTRGPLVRALSELSALRMGAGYVPLLGVIMTGPRLNLVPESLAGRLPACPGQDRPAPQTSF